MPVDATTTPAETGAALKEQLLNTLEVDPFSLDFKKLVSPEVGLTFVDLRESIKRVFNVNESTLLEESTATAGMMGTLNRRNTGKRNRLYYRNLREDAAKNKFRQTVVVEGDSWFQFPYFIKDIIDWLPRKDFNVFSIAYGGDWITNILYEGKYIQELSVHRPDCFLISGGGNDMVGSNRVALMVTPEPTDEAICNEIFRTWRQDTTNDDKDLRSARRYLTKTFFSFILILKAQYTLMFRNLHASSKFANMMIITQGYANARPSHKVRWKNFLSLQPLINKVTGTGRWLIRPLEIRRIPRPIHDHLVRAMIMELNVMFGSLAHEFKNVYHIDARGLVGPNDWYDELHLTSKAYKRVARVYEAVMKAWKAGVLGPRKVIALSIEGPDDPLKNLTAQLERIVPKVSPEEKTAV